jgi:hypothetical protein
MKPFTLTTFFLLFYTIAFSQSTFQSTFESISAISNVSELKSVKQTSDGGYILIGRVFCDATGSEDIELIKTDSLCDTLWTKCYGGIQPDQGISIIQTVDNGYLFTGSSFQPPDILNTLIIKADSIGDTLWTKLFLGNGYSNTLISTFDGNYIFIGQQNDIGIFICKFNDSGDTLWTRLVVDSTDIYPDNIFENPDHSLMVTGGIYDQAGIAQDVYILKLDSAGVPIWAKSFGTIAADEIGFTILKTADGFIINAQSDSSHFLNLYLIKTDAAGNLQWSKSYASGFDIETHDMKSISVNEYVISGRLYDSNLRADLFLIKIDGLGNILWKKTFGGNEFEFGFDVASTNDGGIVSVGYADSFFNTITSYIVKTDSSGNSGCFESTPIVVSHDIPTTTILHFPVTTQLLSPSNINYDITVSNAGFNVNHLCNSLSTTEKSISDNFLLYPNPANNTFRIINKSSDNATYIELIDMFGNSIAGFQCNDRNDGKDYDISALSTGLYYVKICSQSTFFIKIISKL